MTIAITRTDLDAGGFRAAARRTTDAVAARRMLSLALVMEGQNRTEAACAAGMDRQTLRDWVHRYNAQGLHGLTNRPNRGAPKRGPIRRLRLGVQAASEGVRSDRDRFQSHRSMSSTLLIL